MNEHCGCADFEAEDPDDTLSFICVCGHVEDEHGDGFFRRCKFAGPEEEE